MLKRLIIKNKERKMTEILSNIIILTLAVANIYSANNLSNMILETKKRKRQLSRKKNLLIAILSSCGLTIMLICICKRDLNIFLFLMTFSSIFMINYGIACILGTIKIFMRKR